MTTRKIKGSWYVDVYVDIPGEGRQRIRRKSPVNTKRGAERYEQALVEELIWSSSEKKKAPDRRFDDYAVEFLSRYVDVHLKYSTKVTYRSALEVHLVPRFAGQVIRDIDAPAIAALQADLLDGGQRSPKTVRNIVAVLTKALAVAVDWGYLDEVPNVRRLRVPKPKMRFLSLTECEALEACTTGYWAHMIFVARMTGMRIGELRALTWDQVDLDRMTVRIDRAVWRDRMSLPKHDRVRVISLSETTAARLALHRTSALGQHSLVFPKADGEMRGQQRCGNALREIGTRAGTGPIGWHVLRHTFATTLVAAGVNLRAVQDLMGHANLSTTMRYAHLLPDSGATALRALDEFVERGHHPGTTAAHTSPEGDN